MRCLGLRLFRRELTWNIGQRLNTTLTGPLP